MITDIIITVLIFITPIVLSYFIGKNIYIADDWFTNTLFGSLILMAISSGGAVLVLMFLVIYELVSGNQIM